MRRTGFCLPKSDYLAGILAISIHAIWHPHTYAETVLEEVIVTAQKREQPLQDVPVAVTVFSGADIQESGVKDFFDLQIKAPGLVVDANQSATTSNFMIRGIGTNSQNFGLESSVGLYVDGVYRSRQSSMINDLVDIDWLEVLRGPQGTLFGRNTPAGAILLNTAKPDHSNSGFMEATAGNYGLTSVSAAQSLSAIADVLALRGTVFLTQRDGWVDDIALGKADAINDRDRSGARLQGLINPNDDMEIRIIADYSQIDEICCATTVVLDNNERDQRRADSSAYPNGTDSILESRGGTFISSDRVFDHVTAYNQLPTSKNHDAGLSVQFDWTLDTAMVTSISGWRQFDSYDSIDSDFSDLDVLLINNDAEQSSFTQELRIAGLTEHFNYVTGIFYYTQDLDSEQEIHTGVDTAAVASINREFTVLDEWFPADGYSTTINNQEHESWAAFGQMDFPLSDSLYLTAGLRYTKEKKDLDARFNETNAGLGYAFFPPLAPRADSSAKIDDDEWTGTVKLSWSVNHDTLLYTSYGTGYKAGGTNTDRIPEAFETVFEPETSNALEVGMKADFPVQALRLNVALHRTEYDDLQVNTFNGTGFNLQNAATAETYGAEIELLWQASDSLTFTAAYAHTIAEYGEFKLGNCWVASPFRGNPDPDANDLSDQTPDNCSKDGERLGNNPEDFLALAIRKEFVINGSINAFVLTEYTYTGDQVMEASNDPYEFQDSYQLLNLRLGILLQEYNTEVTLWGRNITDEEYYGTNFDPPLQEGKLLAYARDPATYGLTLRKSF